MLHLFKGTKSLLRKKVWHRLFIPIVMLMLASGINKFTSLTAYAHNQRQQTVAASTSTSDSSLGVMGCNPSLSSGSNACADNCSAAQIQANSDKGRSLLSFSQNSAQPGKKPPKRSGPPSQSTSGVKSASPKNFPWIGKLFMHNPCDSHGLISCSGTVVQSNTLDTVDTAAHCLYLIPSSHSSYTGWATKVTFCPQYQWVQDPPDSSVNCPAGVWQARWIEVPSAWPQTAGPSDQDDFGIAVFSPLSQKHLQSTVGAVPVICCSSSENTYALLGYPSNVDSGHSLQMCLSVQSQPADPSDHAVSCGMAAGSSGGPWLIRVNKQWELNGHITKPDGNGLGSPYFTDEWKSVFDAAQDH